MLHSRTIDPAGSRRGVALLAVLAVLALLTILVVAFLMRAQTARNAAANYRNTTNTRLLADTVVNLVEAEINDATTYGSSPGASGTGPYTWASQPGAIRVYDSSGTANANGGGTGFQKLYRLYSAPSLTTSNITDILNVDTTPTSSASDTGGTVKTTGSTPEINPNWSTMPAQWVDLNAPATVSDPSTASSFTVYPILDNRNPSNTAECVQLPGFYVNTLTATTTPYPAAASTSPTTLNPPVMPVQWLYVLQNGQLVAPTGGTGTTVTFTAPNAPTATNPIVGRVAYWTDDDTCKININTAGGSAAYRPDNNSNPVLVGDGTSATTKVFFSTSGTSGNINAWPPAAWDTPRYAGSWDDIRLFAADQPVQGEYQRYPGHPATTSLYYLFRALGVNMPEMTSGNTSYSSSCTSSISSNTQSGGSLPWLYTSSFYGMTPRYNDNAGSQGGLGDTTYSYPPTAITPNRSRLYTSVGELLYSTNASSATPPVRTQNGTLDGATTPASPFLSRQQIETGKFFLTAHSRAPETTLFGTPRICMWPVPDTSQTPTQGTKMAETALDKLIAFCTTTDTGTSNPGNAYYFQRYDSASLSNDWVNETRNQSLYGYLQDLTSGGASNQNIPGYSGGSFVTKYGSSAFTSGSSVIANERDQILTEMVDYIRCTNLNDHSWNSSQSNPLPSGTTTYAAKGEAMPLQITSTAGTTRTASTTQGLGRILTLSEIGLLVICTADGTNNLATINASNTNYGYQTTYGSSSNTATSVVYSPPQFVTTTPASTTTPSVPAASYTVSNTIAVSPVIGSASDPAYVSNLPVAQFLRDTNNNVVDIFGNIINAASGPAGANNTPFPANATLSTLNLGEGQPSGAYGGSLAAGTMAALPIGSRRLQAMVIFEPSSPMNGFDMISNTGGQGPDVNILVTNLENVGFTTSGNSTIYPFPPRSPTVTGTGPNVNGDGYLNGTATTSGTSAQDIGWVNDGDADQGGIFGFRFPISRFSTTATNIGSSSRCNGWSGVGPLTQQATSTSDTLGTTPATQWTAFTGVTSPYKFISNPFTMNTPQFAIGAGTFNVALTLPLTSSGNVTQVPYQTYQVNFPATSSLLNTPSLPAYGFTCLYTSSNNNTYTTHAPDWWGFDNRIGWACQGSPFYASIGTTSSASIGLGCVIRGDPAPPANGWGSGTAWSWATTTGTVTTATSGQPSSSTPDYGDVLRSIVPLDCDYRMTMARYSKSDYSVTVNAAPPVPQPSPPTSDFMTPPRYNTTNVGSSPLNITDMFMEPNGSQGTAGVDTSGSLISFAYAPAISPKVPSAYTYGPNPQSSWDWDSGTAGRADGAYANKPDEGSTYVGASVIPYINSGNQGTITSYFTANRVVSSPVAFGSLPTGVAERISWRNLLFRPQMTVNQGGKRTNGVPGAVVSSINGPEDELLLDNFWMPVVQPYAISEPFSTAGKINMNYQILPFTYITRSTGVQAVLGSELVARVPGIDATNPSTNGTAYYQGAGNYDTEGTSLSGLYSAVTASGTKLPAPGRLPLNLNDTLGSLRQFRAKFMTGDIFRSVAEICDVYLVPRDSINTGYYYDWYNTANLLDNSNADYNKPDAWYGSRGDFALVGNNVRTKPYSDIYPRLTTKSNTYTVYYRVQVLKNPPTADQTQWTEGQGVVTGEYRGSTSIERYLDPNNNNIPDYTVSNNNPAVNSSAPSLDSYYQWRTVANTAFAP